MMDERFRGQENLRAPWLCSHPPIHGDAVDSLAQFWSISSDMITGLSLLIDGNILFAFAVYQFRFYAVVRKKLSNCTYP